MEAQPLCYYVYYSHQKIMQLYRQLPESRTVAVKSSRNRLSSTDAGLRPQEADGRPPPLRVDHIGKGDSQSSYSESCFDKNEMYQLEQVLRALRKSGQLVKATKGAACRPGCYYEVRGCFSADTQAPAPEGCLWLCAPACGHGPALRLLCHKMTFAGECEMSAWEEVWACGGKLPLCGVAICLSGEHGQLCGLPLVLAIS